jgi:hypothetical protein
MERMSVLYRPCFTLLSPLFPLVLVFTSAVSVPAHAGVRECGVTSTNEFLNSRLSFWQQRLDLRDWKLSVVPSHPSELKPETLGNIHWDKDAKTATIRVLAMADYKIACSAALEDMELTVVHELVHLTLAPLRNITTNRGDEEHAVNQIADALLKLERQRAAHPPAPVATVHSTTNH